MSEIDRSKGIKELLCDFLEDTGQLVIDPQDPCGKGDIKYNDTPVGIDVVHEYGSLPYTDTYPISYVELFVWLNGRIQKLEAQLNEHENCGGSHGAEKCKQCGEYVIPSIEGAVR